MKNLLIIVVSVIVLSACAANQQTGRLIGGITGGILGNQMGDGSGKTLATGIGVLLGSMTGSAIGENMDGSPTIRRSRIPHGDTHRTPAARAYNRCSYIRNNGVRSSCERGIADRRRQIQRAIERSAYQCSRYGRCNIFSEIRNLY